MANGSGHTYIAGISQGILKWGHGGGAWGRGLLKGKRALRGLSSELLVAGWS
jgi:hypothetical protein